MKVAILTNNYTPFIGGAEIFVIEHAKFLQKRGHEVDIITPNHDNQEIPLFEVIDGVNIHRINTIEIRGIGFLSTILGMLRLLLKLDNEKPYDVVHSVAESPTGQVATIIKKLRKRPHLITIQGGHLSKKDLDSTFSNKILKQFIKWSFKNSNGLHAISEDLGEESRKLGAKNVIILPNGVNEDMLQYQQKERRRKELGIDEEEKVVVSLARLVPLKGIKYVIEAYNEILTKCPNSRLIIIGDGNQRPELENLVQELDIGHKVEFKGFIPHEEIVRILPAADVFAVTPQYEGLGIVFIEALASGVPVIASKVGGIPDIIEEGKNGLFVDHGDVEKLSESIYYLLSNEEEQEKFRNYGIRTVKEKFLWKSILEKLEKFSIDFSGR